MTDHEVVYTTPTAVERGRANRAIAKAWKIAHFYDAGQGGHGHIFPMEAGLVRPGMFLAAYDMHCSNFGAIGAYAMRAGPDVTVLLATGSLWMQVPQTVRVRLEGAFAPGVHARDLGFFLSSALAEGRLGINPDGVVRPLGILASTAVAVWIAAAARTNPRLGETALFSVVVAVLSWALFVKALGLPLPVWPSISV